MQKIFKHAAQNKRTLMTIGGAVAALVFVGVLSRALLAPPEAGVVVDRGYKVLADTSIKDSERLDTAEKYFREAIMLDPKNARASLGLGLCLGRRGIDKTGKRDERLVAEAMSATNQAAMLDQQLRPECHAQVARFNMWMRQHSDEAHELERAVQLAPHNLRYREALAMAYWNMGAQLNASRYYKSAVAEFQYILSVDPEYPNVRGHIKRLQESFLAQQNQPATTVANRNR
jgi:tetratricopeptide (TPR) repeat protein